MFVDTKSMKRNGMRNDIQCLRAIAIIAVILFHLYPSYFPNGYLGVDMFFVISGFLMALILQKQEMNIENIMVFYSKRIQRIVPVYYLVIFLILFLKQYLQSDVWWNVNNEYGIHSMFFVTNYKIIKEKTDYFLEFRTDTTSNNLFIHCWSLSVEIQFYIIVPFIFYILQKFRNNIDKISIIVLIGLISFYMSNYQMSSSHNFNSMFARIWQFSFGILVYLLRNFNRKLEWTIPYQLEMSALSILFLIFFPIKLHDPIIRPIITFIISFVIFCENGNNMVLSSRVLSYIGDISYILYLVHWPIITFFKVYNNQLLIIYLIIMLSIVIHHTFEVHITRVNIYIVIIITSALLLINYCVVYTSENHPDMLSRSYQPNIQKLINANLNLNNREWLYNRCEKIPVKEFPRGFSQTYGHCRYKKGNGTQKILIIGNSYALNLAETIRQSFNGNYSTFEYFSTIYNFGIFSYDRYQTELRVKASQRIAESMKPDVIFIVTRVDDQQKSRIYDMENDEVIQNINRHLQVYQQSTKKIYILGAFPIWPMNLLNNYVSYLELGIDDLDYFRQSLISADEDMKNVRKRYENINCTKCEVYEIGKEFLKDGYYYGYDDTHSLVYFDNDIHFTNPGRQKVKKFYDRFVQNLHY